MKIAFWKFMYGIAQIGSGIVYLLTFGTVFTHWPLKVSIKLAKADWKRKVKKQNEKNNRNHNCN